MPESLLSPAESFAATPALLGLGRRLRSYRLVRGPFLRLRFSRVVGRRPVAEWWRSLNKPFRLPDPEDIRQIPSEAAQQPNTAARFWRRRGCDGPGRLSHLLKFWRPVVFNATATALITILSVR